MNKKTCCTFLPFFGAFKIFLGYESCAKWIHIFWKFCYFFWCFVHTYEIFYFFWIFSLKCVSRIPSVRIVLKKQSSGKIYEKERRKKEDLYSASSFGFFQCKNPLTTTWPQTCGIINNGTWTHELLSEKEQFLK